MPRSKRVPVAHLSDDCVDLLVAETHEFLHAERLLLPNVQLLYRAHLPAHSGGVRIGGSRSEGARRACLQLLPQPGGRLDELGRRRIERRGATATVNGTGRGSRHGWFPAASVVCSGEAEFCREPTLHLLDCLQLGELAGRAAGRTR